MSFANETPFAAQPVPSLDAPGNDVLVALVETTCLIDRARFPSDLGFVERGSDVGLTGRGKRSLREVVERRDG